MNKKMKLVGASLAVGTLLLCTAAFAGASGNSGYGVFKTAVENSLQAKNVTPDMKVTVKDNGTLLVDAAAAIKLDEAQKAMSGTIKVTTADAKKTTDVFRQTGQMVVKDSASNVYMVSKEMGRHENKAGETENDKIDSARIQDMEKIVDALVGNVQDNFTLQDNSDGTRNVNLKLTESQIPALANAVVSMAMKNADGEMHHGHGVDGMMGDQIQLKLPQLTDGIKIDSLELNATVNSDDLIQSETLLMTVSGKDAAGTLHQVILNAQADFTDYGSTKPDTIDLTGKNVKETTHQRDQMEQGN